MMGFHALWGAALAGLAVPLIVLYFLKLKRTRLDVPSLVLWRQVIDDARVNSPFQRFKRNLLLLLQLAGLAGLVLALMQPFIGGDDDRIERMPILVDCSASMAARDETTGKTRLELAKERARSLVDSLRPGAELAIVSFAMSASRMTGFTSDRRDLSDALERMEIQDVGSDVESALRMAEAMARREPFDSVLLLSDGNFPADVEFDLPFKLDYQRLPPAGQNAGITSFNALRAPGGTWNVFCRMESTADSAVPGTVKLYCDGELVQREDVALQRDATQRVVFSLAGDTAKRLRAELSVDGYDSLATDDAAHLDLPLARPLRVWVSPGLTAVRHALSAMSGLAIYPGDVGADASSYDLVVTDKRTELDLRTTSALYIGLVPDAVKAHVALSEGGSRAIDWQRDSALLRHMELTDVVFVDTPTFAPGSGVADLEALGFMTIVDGASGPVVLTEDRGAGTAVYLLCHTDRSTLPYRVGFPVMIRNLVEIAYHEANLAEVESLKTGTLSLHDLTPGVAHAFTTPSGHTRELKASAVGSLVGMSAPVVGEYTLTGPGGTRMVAASLLDPEETSLAYAQELLLHELTVEASLTPLRPERPLSGSIALAAFCVLLGEWWLFNRRPGVS